MTTFVTKVNNERITYVYVESFGFITGKTVNNASRVKQRGELSHHFILHKVAEDVKIGCIPTGCTLDLRFCCVVFVSSKGIVYGLYTSVDSFKFQDINAP